MATNYTAATNQNFTIPTSGSDQFSRTHVEYLARAVDNHDHSSTKGLAVARVAATSTIYVNDSANATMTMGVTINQGTADDEVLAFKSSDVGHGITGLAETDTFASFRKLEEVSGGLIVYAITDSDATTGAAFNIVGIVNHGADTAKTTSGRGVIELLGRQASGGACANIDTNGNVLVIRAFQAGADYTRFIFDAEGSAHGDVEFVAFDKYDDVGLLDTLTAEFARRADPVKTEFGSWLQEHKDALQREGIVNFYDPNSKRAMVNFTRLAMLQAGAIRQLARRIERAEQLLIGSSVRPTLVVGQ